MDDTRITLKQLNSIELLLVGVGGIPIISRTASANEKVYRDAMLLLAECQSR